MTIQNLILIKWVVGRGESFLEERAVWKFSSLANSSHQLRSTSNFEVVLAKYSGQLLWTHFLDF